MPQNITSAPAFPRGPNPISVPVPPQPAYPAVTFHRTQRLYARRPAKHFPWKDFHLKLSGHGYIVGQDWAMTTFDDRTDDQFFDSKRLQTIDERTEIRYFLPYDPLNYGSELPEMTIAEGVRRLDLHKKEGSVGRMWNGTGECLVCAGRVVQTFFRRLFMCI